MSDASNNSDTVEQILRDFYNNTTTNDDAIAQINQLIQEAVVKEREAIKKRLPKGSSKSWTNFGYRNGWDGYRREVLHQLLQESDKP